MSHATAPHALRPGAHRYASYDGAELAYRVLGPRDGAAAPPLVCLAGGPGRDAAYLGDLGGLDEHRPLVVPDSRGTGASPPAADPSGYAFPRLAQDLEALRQHLGLERFALLAHDAAAATAQAYAAAHPERLSHLVLVCPGARLQGELPDDAREIFEARSDEPWWEDAYTAVQALPTASDLDDVRDLLRRAAPLAYGRWEEPQQAHAASEGAQLGPVPRAGFWQGVDEAARLALVERLRAVRCPALVVTGARDGVTGVRAGELAAASLAHASARALPEVGHFPWVDAPDLFRTTVEDFVRGA